MVSGTAFSRFPLLMHLLYVFRTKCSASTERKVPYTGHITSLKYNYLVEVVGIHHVHHFEAVGVGSNADGADSGAWPAASAKSSAPQVM